MVLRLGPGTLGVVVGAGFGWAMFPGSSLAYTTSYSYDVFGRVVTVSSDAGQNNAYGYDPADNRLSLTATGSAEAAHKSTMYARGARHGREATTARARHTAASALQGGDPSPDGESFAVFRPAEE